MKRRKLLGTVCMLCLLMVLSASTWVQRRPVQASGIPQVTPINSCGLPGPASQAACGYFHARYAFYTSWGEQVALPGTWCFDCRGVGNNTGDSNTNESYADLLAYDTEGAGAHGNLTVEDPGNSPYSAEEIRTANYIADHIFNGPNDSIILRPAQGERAPQGGTSDLLVNGKTYDILSPTTKNTDSIFRSVYNKNSQATGIILDLTDSAATPDRFSNLIGRLVGKASQDGVALNITDVYIINNVNDASFVHLQYNP